jgi:diguanylate cyclase (GGDEF)-like protein
MHIGLSADTTGALRERVFLERLKLFYQSLKLSNTAVVVNSLLLALILQTPQTRDVLIPWLAVTLLIAAYRFTTIWRFNSQSAAQHEARARGWYIEMMLGVSLSGATWGSAGFFLFDLSDVVTQTFLAFIVAGMCAGAVVSLSAFAEAASVFLALSLLPFFARLAMELNPDTAIMAFIVLLYLALMIVFARRVNQTVVTGLEMTHLRSQAEATIERQAMYDALTGLPNRRLLRDRLDQAVSHSRRSGKQAAVLFLDLDYFKRINDSLGHGAGDELLIEVARRLRSHLRNEDTAARLGGDEFVAVLADISGNISDAIALVRRRGEELRQAIEAPMRLQGNEVHVTVSIGVSLLPADTDDVDDLLRHADTAMYRAKDEGRNTLRFFVAEMQQALMKRIGMERDLRAALDSGEGLSLYLQPQHTRDGSICGAEALLRWQFRGEFISPAVFIPVAEDSGLIYRLGDWVVDEACRLAAQLPPAVRNSDFHFAFNVSPRQFRQKRFPDKVLAALRRHGLPRGLVELELTEGLLIDDVEDTVGKMQRLREEGVRFSIDDFGTGYSSLRYLKSLPLDKLKIDQSFIADALANPGNASIVRAIISVAKTLQLEVIAEGVETNEIRDFLSESGCNRFQGFLYSTPVPSDEFMAALVAPHGDSGELSEDIANG